MLHPAQTHKLTFTPKEQEPIQRFIKQDRENKETKD